jgi:hypothetical protein
MAPVSGPAAISRHRFSKYPSTGSCSGPVTDTPTSPAKFISPKRNGRSARPSRGGGSEFVRKLVVDYIAEHGLTVRGGDIGEK